MPHVRVAYAGGLGLNEVLGADRVLFTQEALGRLEGGSAGNDLAGVADEGGAEAAGEEDVAK